VKWRGGTVTEGEVEAVRLRTWMRRSARRQPVGRAAVAHASEGRRRRRSGLSWARWAASPGLAGSIKKAEALLGRRGLGRGKEVGYVAD
jgi:hypothetical protein